MGERSRLKKASFIFFWTDLIQNHKKKKRNLKLVFILKSNMPHTMKFGKGKDEVEKYAFY